MNINEHILKVTGKVTLPQPLELGKSYGLGLDVEVLGLSDKDNQDGTIDRTFSAKMITCDVLKSTGEVMKAEVGNSQSKKLRNQIYAWGLENHPEMDSEELYDRIMNGIRANGDVLFTRIMK